MMGFIFNAIRGLIKLVIKLLLYFVIFAAVIVLIPNLPPYTKFTSIELEPTRARTGPLAPNELLNNAERKYKGKLLGPEAFQLFGGELYTSLATGEIVKISPGGHVTFVTKIGQPCTGLSQEHICGRPLGFQIDDKENNIYVVDAYYGIWKVDLKTDKKQLLVSPRVEIEKRQPKLFNSIALYKNGDFYWTDSSSDFQIKDGLLSSLVDPSGRLFYYNAAKNESKVLVDDLWFPNGLAISPDGQFVVVLESFRYRILKHYIAGPKKGKTEVFIDGLPGLPDNVRTLPDGSGFLAGLYTVFDEQNPLLTRSLAATPIVRKFITRLHRLLELPFEYLNTLYPHYLLEEIVYYIGHFKTVSAFTPTLSGLLHVDCNGNIVATYYNTDGSLRHISDAIVYNDQLYTGSPHVQDFIGSVPVPPLLKNAFATTKKPESAPKQTKKVETKPVEQAPKKATEEKPKVEPKPKLEEKPKEIKPKVEEKPKEIKPKVEEKPKEIKPKVEEKKEAPKVAKPVATESKPKPAESVKPVQKPVEKKPTAEAKQAPPSTPPPKAPLKTEQKPQQTQPKTTTAKPEVKTTPPPKSNEKTTVPPPKTTPTPSQAKTQKPLNENPKPADGKAIPIKEEIPSDTAKPKKDTLKVIKRGGPTEIPAPNQ